MKCVIFIGSMEGGGAEKVVKNLSEKLFRDGYLVNIILYYDREVFYLIDDNIEITVIEKNTKSKNAVINAIWLRNYLIKNNIDILISFLAVFNILAVVASMGTNIPLIVADRNDPRKIPTNLVLRLCRNLAYTFANGVVLQSEYNREYFSKRIKRKSKIIYNPLNINDEVGKALTEKKHKYIITVGRLVPQKNQKMLIKAFIKFHNNHPEYTLIIYGEGNERAKLEKYIKDNNVEKNVYLPGQKKDILNEILKAEIFVLSSNYEGMPNALAEAMGVGLPVISTKVSGATELITDGVNGLLVDINDVEGLFLALERYASDLVLRKKCAEKAVKVTELLSNDKIIDQWEAYIVSLLNGDNV